MGRSQTRPHIGITGSCIAILAAIIIGTSGAVVLGAPRITWQRTCPAPSRGRIAAAFGITDAAAGLTGALLGPTLAQAAGLHTAANIAAATTLGAAALTLLLINPTPPHCPRSDA